LWYISQIDSYLFQNAYPSMMFYFSGCFHSFWLIFKMFWSYVLHKDDANKPRYEYKNTYFLLFILPYSFSSYILSLCHIYSPFTVAPSLYSNPFPISNRYLLEFLWMVFPSGNSTQPIPLDSLETSRNLLLSSPHSAILSWTTLSVSSGIYTMDAWIAHWLRASAKQGTMLLASITSKLSCSQKVHCGIDCRGKQGSQGHWRNSKP